MKYFRSYPWGLQLLLFGLMMFTLMSSATVIIFSLLPKLSGYMPAQISHITPASSPSIINTAIWVQAASSLFIFLMPAFLFAYLTHPSFRQYLGLRPPAKKINMLLAVLLILGAMPLLEAIQYFISLIPFGPEVKAAQKANDDMTEAFLKMGSFAAFIKVFLIMAIMPGVGEEMFFRGILMRFTQQRSRTVAAPILFSALIFAFAHGNVYGLLSIFLAGVLLGSIYYLTGSLWCSIMAHIFFNGTQVILSYISTFNPAMKALTGGEGISVLSIVFGAVVFGASLYLLLKNKTPLPANWADNFSADELRREENR